MRLHLMVARNALKPEEIQVFLSNAVEDVPAQTLLLVAFLGRPHRQQGRDSTFCQGFLAHHRAARDCWQWLLVKSSAE